MHLTTCKCMGNTLVSLNIKKILYYLNIYIYISENILSIEHPSLYCKHLFYLYQYSIRPICRLRTVGLERSGDSWVWVGCMMCHLRSSRVGTTWTNSGGECCTLKKTFFYAKERTFYGLYTGWQVVYIVNVLFVSLDKHNERYIQLCMFFS